MSSIISPAHFGIFQREATTWNTWDASVFFNPGKPIDVNDIEALFGITEEQVVTELFRHYEGKLGFYLVNLRDREYYYCGLQWSGIKAKLLELGIGRADPMEAG